MANLDQGTPIRSQDDGSDERVHVKQVGAATAGLGDVAANQRVVDSDGASPVTAVDLDIRNLAAITDTVTIVQATHDNLQCNANIQIGDVDVAIGNPVFVSPGTGATFIVSSTDLDIRNLVESQDSILIYGNDGATNRKILTDSTGAIVISGGGEGGVDVHNIKAGAAIAKNASDTNTYTVPALKILKLKSIHSSASAAAHIQIKIGTPASEADFTWRFLRGGGDNDDLILQRTKDVVAGDNVLVIMTNKDNQAQDLFSVIEGHLVDV